MREYHVIPVRYATVSGADVERKDELSASAGVGLSFHVVVGRQGLDPVVGAAP